MILPDGVHSLGEDAEESQDQKAQEQEGWLELGLNTVQ